MINFKDKLKAMGALYGNDSAQNLNPPKPKKKRASPERDLQIKVVAWMNQNIDWNVVKYHHSPNGGKRNRLTAWLFKLMGTSAGYPDLHIAKPMRGKPGMFIEFKSPGGYTSKPQKEWLEYLKMNNYKILVTSDYDEAIREIEFYLGLSYG